MKLRLLQIAFALLGLGVLASASPIPVTITFDSGGPASPGGVPYFPYTITVPAVSPSPLTVACDDFVDHVGHLETYNGFESDYTDLSKTLYNGGATAASAQYNQLAYLYQQFQVASSDNVTAAINYAIWDLFQPAPAIDSTISNSEITQAQATADLVGAPSDQNNSAYWLNKAATFNFTGFDFTEFRIFTPDLTDSTGWLDGKQPQEFIGEVPEPATLALLGTGLLLLGFAFKRRLHDGSVDLQG